MMSDYIAENISLLPPEDLKNLENFCKDLRTLSPPIPDDFFLEFKEQMIDFLVEKNKLVAKYPQEEAIMHVMRLGISHTRKFNDTRNKLEDHFSGKKGTPFSGD